MWSRTGRSHAERVSSSSLSSVSSTVVLAVVLAACRDGTITDIQRDKSSGFEVLDAQSDRALRLTRLPPLPGQFTNPTLTVYMEFEYLR